MIARYLARRLIGWFLRLGRTLRGRERHSTPKMGTHSPDTAIGPIRGTREAEDE